MLTETIKEPEVGRFSVEVELANDRDLIRAEEGLIARDQIPKVKIRGVVDTGATRLVIPDSVAKQLGLTVSEKIKVRYADGRTAVREVAQRVRLFYGDRNSVFDAVVEPGRQSALIGAVVLEVLDFVVDPIDQRLVPRDPRHIVSESEGFD